MRLFIDPAGANLFTPTTQDGGRHYYSAAAPFLAILRIDDSDLTFVRGRVVDAQIGWDQGTRGFVRGTNEGRQHTKITIRRVLGRNDTAIKTLSQVLRDAPRETRIHPVEFVPQGEY